MLQNKKILIAGLANKHSIAAGIAKAMHAQGVRASAVGEAQLDRVRRDRRAVRRRAASIE